MAKKTDTPSQASNDELQRSATYFWELAQEQGLHPEELVELIRRLASGELCENVLPQRFLPLAEPSKPTAPAGKAAQDLLRSLAPLEPPSLPEQSLFGQNA